jgi:hypothetical protein
MVWTKTLAAILFSASLPRRGFHAQDSMGKEFSKGS